MAKQTITPAAAGLAAWPAAAGLPGQPARLVPELWTRRLRHLLPAHGMRNRGLAPEVRRRAPHHAPFLQTFGP